MYVCIYIYIYIHMYIGYVGGCGCVQPAGEEGCEHCPHALLG
jgi:hypothetical protein